MSTTPASPTSPGQHPHKPGKNPYPRFFAMIVTSTALMYGLMYMNTFSWDHVVLSETRFYMTLVMGATMAVVMLSFMWKMHPNKRANLAIYVGSAVVFLVALLLVRSQRTVQDVSYMRSMIPHHSVAILASERAEISDTRVRRLADQIIESQRKEIEDMKSLIDEIQANGRQTDTTRDSAASLP